MPILVAGLALSLCFAAEIWGIHKHTGHYLLFTLDAPYIHLALAQNILHGTYGLNPGEYASPSSSILYPFILAPFAGSAYGTLWALSLNIAASFGVLVLWRRLFQRFGFAPWGAAGAAFLATIAVNGASLPFTGMEHMAHVFFTLATVLGVLDVAENRDQPWFLTPAALIGALLRFEGGVVAAAAALVLAWSGRRRAAAVLMGLVLLSYAAFALFLHLLGLAPIPNSILAKSANVTQAAGGGGIIALVSAFVANFRENIKAMNGLAAAAALILVCIVYFRRRDPLASARLKVGAFALIIGAAQIVIFRFVGFYRYEVYAVAAVLACIGYCLFSGLPRESEARLRQFRWASFAGMPLLILLIFYYLPVAMETPVAAENIYEQQFQIHRFVAEDWKEPVAVSTLGRVAYQSDDYIFDLRGFSSPAAEKAYQTRSKDWMANATRARDIDLAIISNDGFNRMIPTSWSELARLHLASRRVTAPSDVVHFYLIDPQDRPQAEAALKSFSRRLPRGVRLDLLFAPTPPVSSAVSVGADTTTQ